MKQSYESHFTNASINIINYIKYWPDNIQIDDVIKFVNYIDANMLYVPVFNIKGKEKISRNDFYCSSCHKWLKINESIKQIKNHASVHIPDLFKKQSQNNNIIGEEQNKLFIKNITFFILFETNSFRSIESLFLKNISRELPSRERITLALKNIANYTRREIKSLISISKANYLTFDQWTDSKNRDFLGITIRSYINKNYKDFFLDLIYLYSEINNADLIANKVKESLQKYGLYMIDIVSCTTDNCPLMVQSVEKLLTWRIPCVLHILNKIFQVFIENIKNTINPIFVLINFLNKSTKYQNYLDREKEKGIIIKKVPGYCEVHWTSFSDSLITLYETQNKIKEFLGMNNFLDKKQLSYLSILQNLCKAYKKAVLEYESDSFGAISYFLVDIKIINNKFTDLETSDFRDAAIMAKEKINEYKKIYWYFWDVICPIAVLLNPRIEEYKLLLNEEQIEASKREIERRMSYYTYMESEEEEYDSEESRVSLFKKNDNEEKEVPQVPIVKLLEKRNCKIKDLKDYWEKKIGTSDNQMAYVAMEILGALVTSVM